MPQVEFYAKWDWKVGDLYAHTNADFYHCREIAFGDGRRRLTSLLDNFMIDGMSLEHARRQAARSYFPFPFPYLGIQYWIWDRVFTSPIQGSVDVLFRRRGPINVEPLREINAHFPVTIEPMSQQVDTGFSTQEWHGFRVSGGVEIAPAFFYATLLARGERISSYRDQQRAYEAVRSGTHTTDYKWLYVAGNGPEREYTYAGVNNRSKMQLITAGRDYLAQHGIAV